MNERVRGACGLDFLICLALLVLPIANGTAQAAPPLFDDLGSLHHPISTTSELAQQYFDQGLRLVYAVNHEEAVHSFEEAARHDPNAAMPYWGIALALGPNINAAMAKEDERRAIEAIKNARARLEKAGLLFLDHDAGGGIGVRLRKKPQRG